MKNQVLSIAQMQHLQELGLNTSDASMHYQFLPTADSIINGTKTLVMKFIIHIVIFLILNCVTHSLK